MKTFRYITNEVTTLGTLVCLDTANEECEQVDDKKAEDDSPRYLQNLFVI